MSPQDYMPGNETTLQNDESTISFTYQSRQPAGLGIGTSLGRYRLIRLLGKGGFGQVWEVEDTEAGRHLALKVLTHIGSTSPEVLRRFKREGQLAASLNHPRSVYVFGAEEIQGHPVIAMELMPGGTLQDRVQLLGKLPVKIAVDYLIDVIEGLKAAQDTGIVHRDVKPSNCFIDEDGHAKIGDFGISKSLEPQPALTFAEAFVGTPAYASPEQIRGRDVDYRSDIYSVGATLYSLLTGTAPFEGKNAGELLARILSEEPVPFVRRQVHLPTKLDRIVRRCMAKDREKRYPSYESLRADLLPYSSANRLTAGSLAKRFSAFVMDEAVVGLGLFPIVHALGSGWAIEIAYNALHLLYYLIPEAVWGRTAGKYLMGLRVVSASGAALTLRQAVSRVLVFAAIALPSVLLQFSLGATPLLDLATVLAYLVTMRRDNLFAGPHEIASGTRVMADRATVLSRVDVARPVESRTVLGEERPLRFGPYRALKDLWRNDAESLVLAFDDLLRRNVWVHVSPHGISSADVLAVARPGKLRWLQGGQHGLIHWNAFEAPQGTNFCDWVRERDAVTWGDVRDILLGISDEISARLEKQPSITLSLRHIWIDLKGQPKLLEFPAFLDGAQFLATSIVDAFNAKIFFQQAFHFALTGQVKPQSHLHVPPAVPLPEYARLFAGRLCRPSGAFTTIAEIHSELRRLASQTAEVGRAARAGMLGSVVLLPVVSLLVYALLPGIETLRMPSWQRELRSAAVYDGLLKNLEAYGDIPDVKESKQAACQILAWIYHQAMTAPGGRPLIAQFRTFQRERLEACGKQYPAITESQAMEARSILTHCKCRGDRPGLAPSQGTEARALVEQQLAETRPVARLERGATLIFWAGGFLWIFPVGLSLIYPPGLLVRAFGFTLQTTSGKLSTRSRCAARALLAWFPFAMFFPAIAATGFAGSAPDAAHYWKSSGVIAATLQLQGYSAAVWPIDVALACLVALGIVSALARPARSLPDRLAGTCLVPR